MNTTPSKGAQILEAQYDGAAIERWPASEATAARLRVESLRARRPVIVQGLIDDWPARSKWTLDDFAERFGRLFTNAFATGDEGGAQPIRFRRLVERMRGGEAIYSSFYPAEALPLLRRDYTLDGTVLGDADFNWLLQLPQRLHGQTNVVFVGNRGTGIANHQDSMGTHLWSAQICGRKRWWVSPPEMSPFLADGQASWRRRDADVEHFPAFADAACLDFVLEPGEVLFLPVGWWHETEIVEDSISITHDIVNETNYAAYAYALEHQSEGDPKVAEFRAASADLHPRWQAALPARATEPVERIAGPIDFDQLLSQYLEPRRPVVLEGQIDHWPARSSWSIEHLRERFGRLFVQSFEKRDDQSRKERLARFLDGSSDPPRYAMWCLDDCVVLFEDDITPLPFLDGPERDWTADLPARDRNALTWIFLGRAGSGIGLHSDRLGQHVASAQVVGRKRWWLHPASDAPWLYDGAVDLAAPDLRRFPLYANASPVRTCVLEPGDVLVLPDGWWHQTRAIDDSVSVSHDFFNISNAEQFIGRLEARKGREHLESEAMAPIVAGWRARMAEGRP